MPANVAGTPGDDRLTGGAGRDAVEARRGDDRVLGRRGADSVCGNPGADRISGGPGPDGDRFGAAYSPTEGLFGQRGADSIGGGPGNDYLAGANHGDGLRGGTGRDRVAGGRGSDELRGGPGADLLLGGPGDDRIEASDRQPETVDCGPGEDRAIVDPVDEADESCEHVSTSDASSRGHPPPRPFMHSHRERIGAAINGFCSREAVEANDCVLPEVFLKTRRLPVHQGGHIRIDTRARAEEVHISFDCGGTRAAEERTARRWRVRVALGRDERRGCSHGTMTVRYGDAGRFDGGTGFFQFSISRHRHER